MRITILFDSATTDQVRALSVALNKAIGSNELSLGVEGPTGWHGHTPSLHEHEYADVSARFVHTLLIDAEVTD